MRKILTLAAACLLFALAHAPAGDDLGAQPLPWDQAERQGSWTREIEVPELIFEAPPELAGKIEQLERFDTASLASAMRLVGLEEPGPPIRVIVAPEGSPEARLAPSWAIAYAVGEAGIIVMIPNRVPTYPDTDFFQVLRHEILHVLVARAAGRQPVPRWFNEGLAMVGSHEWQLEDRGRLVIAAFRRQHASMVEVSEGFGAGSSGAASAYAVSGAFVRYLLEEEGDLVAARILERLSVGESFPSAVRSVTGHSLAELEGAFWAQLDLWNRWVPILSSSALLWALITALFLIATARRRARDEEIRLRWIAEEDAERAAELRDAPTGGWVH
ncbi:MAG: hypothetical protein AAF725_26195 [Acidobacteriota bacterium]